LPQAEEHCRQIVEMDKTIMGEANPNLAGATQSLGVAPPGGTRIHEVSRRGNAPALMGIRAGASGILEPTVGPGPTTC
jgi:hypothetical protein